MHTRFPLTFIVEFSERGMKRDFTTNTNTIYSLVSINHKHENVPLDIPNKNITRATVNHMDVYLYNLLRTSS